jgi:acetolactate synthase I/II/III large subunit
LARPERAEWLIETLRSELPCDSPLFCDACELGYRLQADWPSNGPRLFFYPSNYIALGWGYPAALGAAVALGDRHVVSVSGDGGFLVSCQELATAARYRLRVIALVHNDSTFGAIKNIQRRDNDARYLDVDLNNPDFLALAAAYGLPSHRTRTVEELRRALRMALELPGPSLIEVLDQWRMIRE